MAIARTPDCLKQRFAAGCALLGRFLLWVSALSFAQAAQAFNPQSDIREIEWHAWPDYCKAAYVLTDYSAGSIYRHRMPKSQAKRILNSYGGDKHIPGAHHFCVGVALLQRVELGTGGPKKKNEWASLAVGEFFYCYKQMEPTSTGFGIVSDYYGRSLRAVGEVSRAYTIWQIAISSMPNDKRSYLSMTRALIEDGHQGKALEVIRSFPDEEQHDDGEYQFTLASALYENGAYEEARTHAENALSRGIKASGLIGRIKAKQKPTRQ